MQTVFNFGKSSMKLTSEEQKVKHNEQEMKVLCSLTNYLQSYTKTDPQTDVLTSIVQI